MNEVGGCCTTWLCSSVHLGVRHNVFHHYANDALASSSRRNFRKIRTRISLFSLTCRVIPTPSSLVSLPSASLNSLSLGFLLGNFSRNSSKVPPNSVTENYGSGTSIFTRFTFSYFDFKAYVIVLTSHFNITLCNSFHFSARANAYIYCKCHIVK